MWFIASANLSGRRLEALVQSVASFVDEALPEVDVFPVIPADQIVELVQLIGYARDVRAVRQRRERGEYSRRTTDFQILLQLE